MDYFINPYFPFFKVADLYRKQENTGTKKPVVPIEPEDY